MDSEFNFSGFFDGLEANNQIVFSGRLKRVFNFDS
jgi:hypothetical protein